MAFSIVFSNSKSPSNKVSKELITVRTLTGTLRDKTSVIDPAVIIEYQDGNPIGGVNYMYIEEFGRYYYVTNCISLKQGLWEIHGHVDVLMSYSESIKAQSAVVARQEASYNLYLDDGVFMTYQNPRIQTLLFSEAAPFETQEFVLVVAGS